MPEGRIVRVKRLKEVEETYHYCSECGKILEGAEHNCPHCKCELVDIIDGEDYVDGR